MKYTPGPWKQYGENGIESHNGRRVIQEDDYEFSGVGPWPWCKGHTVSEQAANINLIAAAPGMYEALKKAIDLVDRDVIRVRGSERQELIDALEQWNIAIAKAEGGE